MSEPDPDDDPRLTSLRSVWLSLPDEEPPQRGLAALMAAARMQADAMARPPWWRRALDVMRRPPVLALATVVVLIGGAVLVGKRDALDAEHVTSPAPTPAADDKREAPAPVAPPPAAAAPEPGAPAPDENQAAHGETVHSEREHATPKPARRKSAPAPALGHSNGIGIGAARDDAPMPPPKAGKAASGDAPAMKAERALEQAPGALALPQSAPADSRSAQLAAQCLAAAARGDCPTVRALVAQLRQDRAGYATVAADAAVQRCLAAR